MALYSNSSSYPFPEQTPGLHNNIFRPPLTPGETGTHAATPSQDRPLMTRKRTRTDSVKANTSAALQYGYKDSFGNSATSPAPLANSRYTLAGGFDTPGLAAAFGDDNHDPAGERDFRWKWDSENMSPDQPTALGPLARERNGMARMASSTSTAESSQKNGWGSFMFSIVGGVAGRMWQFCRHSAFKGFYAGGGQGFDFNEATQLPSPLPGHYPDSDFFGDFEQDNTPVRPSKRLHTEQGSGWVMVDRAPDPSRLSVRKISSGNLTHLGATRASSRRNADGPVRRTPSRQVSYTGSPQAIPRLDAFDSAFTDTRPPTVSTASTAPTRSPIIIRPSTALHYRSPVASPQRGTHGGSRRGSAVSASGDPLTPDAQRFISRKERQDRDTDKSFRKMSRQVQDLIRQGQAALGTKVEVDDFDCDNDDDDADGWEDAAAAARS